MGRIGHDEFPYPRYLRVPFVFVPTGSPPPLDWMAAHPGFVKFAATFVPRPGASLSPEPGPASQSAPREEPSREGAPLANQRDDAPGIAPPPLMEGDPRLARPFPGRLLKIVPPPPDRPVVKGELFRTPSGRR